MFRSLHFNNNVVNNVNISIQGISNNVNNFSIIHDRVSKESLFDKVLNQVQEKNKNNKYNFAYNIKKKSKLEDSSIKNVIDNSNTIIIVPDSNISKDHSTSQISLEKQSSQFQIIKKQDTVSLIKNETFQIEANTSKNNVYEFNSQGLNSQKLDNSKIDSRQENILAELSKNEESLITSKEISKKIGYIHHKENSYFSKDESFSKIENELKKNCEYLNKNVENLFSSKRGKLKFGLKNKNIQRNSKSIHPKQSDKSKNQFGLSFDYNTQEGISSYLNKKLQEKRAKNFKKASIFDKENRKHNNHLNANLDRPKQVDKELDLGFLPKDLLYNDKTTYGESTMNLLAAIEILEKAQDAKDKIVKTEKPKEEDSFWSKMNPFKCGNYT